MADFTQIIQEINEDITTNGVGAITGAKLNEVLRDMIAAVNAEKQDPLTIDATPTEDSTNPVQSGGMYSILERIFPNSSLFGGFVTEHTPVSEDRRLYFLTEVSGDLPNFELYNLPDNGKWKFIHWNPRDDAWDCETIDSYTSDQIDQLLSAVAVAISGKQDTISDLATIRSGAAAGATAYQKPSGGIPKTDLASAVQTSLGKADTAVQQVTVGTTTTGNAGTNASVTNSGTVTNPVLDFTIPRGADGADGQDAVNPFKGWYASTNALPANPVVGDYAYVKGAESTDPAAIYECTTAGTWSDSGRTADTSNVQTFASSQEVNEVYIVNDLTTGGIDDVLSAEQGKTLNTQITQLGQEVDELINGEVISTQITLDDIDDDGAILNYYLNMSSLTPTGGSNTIITKPIYLNVGDSVTCQTGGTGIVLFGKSPSGNIDRFTTGFTSIKIANDYYSVTTYNTTISEAGWYVFSGRINRNDGTNLVINVIKYSRDKGIQEQLDEKADKNDLIDINIPAIGLSVGADKVKDAIPTSPWFDTDSQSSGFDYGTYLDDKLDSVPCGQRFIFITDYHYGSNVKNSAKLIDYCRNRLGIKTIIHGGDVHNEHETAERAVQDWLNFNRDFVFRIGNDFKQVLGDHDRNGGTGHTPISYEVLQKLITGYDSHELNFDDLYDEQVSELGWSSSDMSQYEAFKRMHYFFDDVTIKTRFICLVTRIIPQGQGLVYDKLGDYNFGVLLLQMDFLYSALMSTPKGYNIVVIGHNVVGDIVYSVSVEGSTVSRYNVNEPGFKGYWINVTKQLRGFMNKTAFSTNIEYLDWESEGIETKNYDFSNAPDAGIIFCIGGDVHWDILAKSQLVGNSEVLSTVETISLPSGTEPTVATQGTINKNTDILHIVTMTDGGDRGYRGIVEAPTQDYDDSTDSFRICKSNTAGTIDSQAFDIVTISNDGIYFTRIGSGNDRMVYLE